MIENDVVCMKTCSYKLILLLYPISRENFVQIMLLRLNGEVVLNISV